MSQQIVSHGPNEPPVSAQVMELVLGSGEVSKLSSAQRVAWQLKVCDSLGLNPLTRPIRFLKLGPDIVPYVTRDGADQLRRLHAISLAIVNQSAEAGIYTVHVRATTPGGRTDEDVGVVLLPSGAGEVRANAVMRAVTKAKRRVTLSICGLGFMSEEEKDTLPHAREVIDEEPLPPPPPPPPAGNGSGGDRVLRNVDPPHPVNGGPQRQTMRQWLDLLEQEIEGVRSPEEAEVVLMRPDTLKMQRIAEGPAMDRLQGLIDRLWAIKGEAETPEGAR